MLYGIATAITALLLAAVLSALLRVPALRLGLVHRRRARPVPLLGGVAVVASTWGGGAGGGGRGAAPRGEGAPRLLAAGAGVGALGLVADVWRLKTQFLLLGAAVAAAFVVPYDETGVPAGIAAVLWIACVAAAFRGLDHADGLAGTVGVLTAFGAGACAAAEMMDDLAVLLSVLAAALTGFLMHNWQPARIAFGACGSLFTGFVLAASAVLVRTGYGLGSTGAVLFPLTAVVTADAVLVVLSRRLAGRPVVRHGPDHLAHRLRRLGLTTPGAVVLVGATTFATVLVGVLVHVGWLAPSRALWVAGALLPAVLGLLCVRVYVPRRPGGPHATGTRTSSVDLHTTRTAHTYGTRTTRAEAHRAATGRLGAPRSPDSGRLPAADDAGARGPRARGAGVRRLFASTLRAPQHRSGARERAARSREVPRTPSYGAPYDLRAPGAPRVPQPPSAASLPGTGAGAGFGAGIEPGFGLESGRGIGSGHGPGLGSAYGPGLGSAYGPGLGSGPATPARRHRDPDPFDLLSST
ncbi:MraY family glycosyltransferase [Streptomyces mexicanus]|uniref:MraY family glycosyltransferase n=1 Tax=Streptomyces mexicanus TaxID=178566 RepID=UPI00365EBE88